MLAVTIVSDAIVVALAPLDPILLQIRTKAKVEANPDYLQHYNCSAIPNQRSRLMIELIERI